MFPDDEPGVDTDEAGHRDDDEESDASPSAQGVRVVVMWGVVGCIHLDSVHRIWGPSGRPRSPTALHAVASRRYILKTMARSVARSFFSMVGNGGLFL